MPEIYAEPLSKRYNAARCSLAWMSKIGFLALIVILPYFVAFASWGFWKKHSTFREQPRIRFKHKSVLLVQGSDSSQILYHSTMPEYNDLIGSKYLTPVLIKASEIDVNRDDIVDYFNITMKIPLQNGQKVHSVKALLFFELHLHDRVKLVMEGIGVIQKDSPLPGLEYHVIGDLMFRQSGPLPIHGYRTKYKSSVLEPDQLKSITDIKFQRIYEDYAFRNESLFLDSPYSNWVPGASNTFTVSVKARVPVQTILYTPDASESIKWAWIQYLGAVFAVYFLVDVVRSFIYREQVIETTIRLDTVPISKMNQF